ncbi:hypothetical protein RN001_001737 [Aquatica leii]|uniref:FAM21/CAPZIP domain-containing protein n=1 Tax=Aquatica leii TaxID=1421715 RepID=A0AAN7SCW1_9COLE|nr:hypothetical protein RN001_001737 [Aquatica leii]
MSSKSWQRPWSIEEIVQNASNWNLAGDAGILKYLELFSENLLSKAESTNNNLNDLLSRLNNTSLSLDEVKNDFRSLRNTQFIESRVYDDDETVPGNHAEGYQEKKNYDQSESSKIQDMKDAIIAGIDVVEKYFDKVDVPGSDSEDDTDFPSFVLKPKDPYGDRPLPYVIGTDEWYKKWHVGLIDSSSDSEADKISEKFSESDSDSDFTKDKIVNHPVANSTFEEGQKPDLFGTSDAEDNNSTPSYPSLTNKNFANELAAKLGSFVDEHSNVEEEINRRPINTAPRTTPLIQNFGNLFSDEPPPIEDFIDNNVTGLFSGGEGLFDNIDNSVNLWKEEQTIKTDDTGGKPKISGLFDEDNLFSNSMSYGNDVIREDGRIENVKNGGLFDDEDDALFNNNNFTNSKRNVPYLQSNLKVAVPLITEEPPELKPIVNEDSVIKSKKPVGGVKIMENSNLFDHQKIGDILKHRRQRSSNSESDSKPDIETADKTPTKRKPLSLFDDDDDEEDDFEKDLFITPNTRMEIKVVEKETKTEPQKAVIAEIRNDFKEDILVINETKAPESKVISLFGEDDDDNKSDDLFSDSLFVTKPQVQNKTDASDSVYVPPLFDAVPPELDDSWDSRSDNLFDDNDTGLFDNIPEMSSHRSGLFDNEPPSLFFESSGIVKDFSTRVATDESFSPYASSSRRFSSDIFNEQQSNDSFFVTKNEVQSNLEIIPEASYIQTSDSSQSIIEITPSGCIDDLFTDSTSIATNTTKDFIHDGNINVPTNSNETEENFPSKDSPGKLKHNLKINVSALKPGASPKKPTIQRTLSLEVPSTEEENVKRLSLKFTDNPSTFENLVKDVEVLSSVTKVRAKIPFKRAPSSRKARQESLRNSVPDFKILASTNNTGSTAISNIPQSKSDEFVDIFDEEIKSVKTIDGLFQSDDLFAEKEKDVLSLVKKVVSIEEVSKQSVINTDNFASDDYKQLNLFDDSEDFDGIFSTNKLPPKSNILSKSLFDNDDDDYGGDVFGTTSSFTKISSKSSTINKKTEKKPLMTVPVKKLLNSEVVEDPLSSFLDE